MCSGHAQKMIGLAYFQVAEKDLIELVIVVLPGVDQNMVRSPIELAYDQTHLDEFRPSPDDREDLPHASRNRRWTVWPQFLLDVVQSEEEIDNFIDIETPSVM